MEGKGTDMEEFNGVRHWVRTEMGQKFISAQKSYYISFKQVCLSKYFDKFDLGVYLVAKP